MTDMTPYRKLAADIGCGDSGLIPLTSRAQLILALA